MQLSFGTGIAADDSMTDTRDPTARSQEADRAVGSGTQTSPSRPGRADRAAERIEEPRIERIARRAFEIYEARGGQNGRALEDWLQAEREIDNE